jgi:hypothetical protein
LYIGNIKGLQILLLRGRGHKNRLRRDQRIPNYEIPTFSLIRSYNPKSRSIMSLSSI